MTTTAVVILNWNGRHFLEKFLPPLVERTKVPGTSLVVVDNASTDDSCAFLTTHYPQIRQIQLDKNYGFTGGYNRALQQVMADYYVLLNSDVEVSPDWLDPLVNLMDNDERVGVCMPKIRSYADGKSFEYAGASGGFIDRFGFPFCRGRILSTIEEDRGQYDNATSIFWATGACMMVRSSLFHALKGFDDAFFAHMEEIDFCWRAQIAGNKIMCEPASVVYHVGGGTLPNNNPRKLYYNYRNSLYMLYKNLPRHKRPFIFGVRLILDGLSALAYLAGGHFSFFTSVWHAHMDFWKNRHTLHVTEHNNNNTKVEGIYQRSIVWDFFVKGRAKLRFSQLSTHHP